MTKLTTMCDQLIYKTLCLNTC